MTSKIYAANCPTCGEIRKFARDEFPFEKTCRKLELWDELVKSSKASLIKIKGLEKHETIMDMTCSRCNSDSISYCETEHRLEDVLAKAADIEKSGDKP